MNARLNVTLTGTRNYPDAPAPVRGELELFELGADGSLVSAVFRRLQRDGRLAAPVEIKDPRFTYTPGTDAAISRARFIAQAAELAGWTVDDPIAGELRCPDCGEPLSQIVTGAVGHSGDTCSTTNPFTPAPAPIPEAWDEAITAAITDQGEAGATVRDIEIWAADNRLGGPIPRAALYRRLIDMTSTGRLTEVRTPTSRKWFIVPVTAATGTDALDRVIAATVAAHPGCVSSDNVQAWIDPALLAVVPPRAALLASLDRLCDRGTIWQQGARGAYFPERQDCPDCETNGVNCRAHRHGSVGTAARSGRQ